MKPVPLAHLRMGGRGVQVSVSSEASSLVEILSQLIDFRTPSWLGKLSRPSRLQIQSGENAGRKFIRQPFDGACDESKPGQGSSKLLRWESRSGPSESRHIDLFQDQNFTATVPTPRFDGSAEDSKPPPVGATLSRLSRRANSSDFFSRPTVKKLQSSDSIRSSCSQRSLDRFLPRRPTLNSAATSYHANKDPQSLSPEEKILRHSGATPDAFSPRRRATSPTPRSRNLIARRNLSANNSGGSGRISICRSH